MSFDLFINFDGNCKEAIDFYAKAFKSEVQGLMTYGDMPPDPDFVVTEDDKKLVMYSCVPIFGCNVMFCDNPSGMPLIVGNNISPTISTDNKDEITRLFHALGEGGKVEMELQKTFWSELFGSVTDKFGIMWQLSHNDGSGY